MSSRSRYRSYPSPKLDMAAMIDVVFLLLIFFVMLIRPEDVYAKLNASTGRKRMSDTTLPTTYRVVIKKDGFLAYGTPVTYEKMDHDLANLTKWTDDLAVVICAQDESEHGKLIQVLDLCQKYGIANTQLLR